MATITKSLTTEYSVIAAAAILVTANSSRSIELIAGSAPVKGDRGHKVNSGETRLFLLPADGSWFAKSDTETGSITYTEV